MTKERREEFRIYVAGIIAHYLDTKERQCRTKKWLADTVRRALWAIRDCPPDYRAERVTEGLIKSCVEYLNNTQAYVIMPNRSPKGYVCVFGKRNATPDILTTVTNIRFQKKTIYATIDNQILKPTQRAIQIQIPAGYEIGAITIQEAEFSKKQLTEASDLEDSIKTLQGMGKTRFIEQKTLKVI
jgi:hypothetical protein